MEQPNSNEPLKAIKEDIIERKGHRQVITSIICGVLGIIISLVMYFECLHDDKCNVVVVIFFSLLALSLFQHIGLPVNKFLNRDNVKDSTGY